MVVTVQKAISMPEKPCVIVVGGLYLDDDYELTSVRGLAMEVEEDIAQTVAAQAAEKYGLMTEVITQQEEAEEFNDEED